MNFEELNLAAAIVKAVREQGYTAPTPIQTEAIPVILAGHDLLGGAQTGTGKTAAFTLPMLHRLAMSRGCKNRFGGVGIRALVLTPTRELAAQVEESIRTYGKYLQLSSTVIFGGVGMNPQIQCLKQGVDILVATPGRLLDLQQQGVLDLSTVRMLVLDEADRMLDMGFIHDVRKVLALVPSEKQSLLFSATFSEEIRALANNLLRNPQSVQVTPANTTVQRISQIIHPVGRGKKKALLAHIVQRHNWSQVLVFTRTKFGANNVAEFLEKQGITAMALHGNKSQAARTQALAGFKSGAVRVLVATDIAARGIDIDELPHVVNYEIPNVSEDYVHRIGRTGRAGNDGTAINLVCLDEEGFMQDIERFTRQSIMVEVIDGYAPESGERAEPIAMGRQTIWGGLGKPPGREVMAAAAKAARVEMLQRMRDNRGGNKNASSERRDAASTPKTSARPQGAHSTPATVRSNTGRNPDRNSSLRGRNSTVELQPRSHEDRFARGVFSEPRPARSPAGQPDPMRTSVDLMAERGRTRNGGGRRPESVRNPASFDRGNAANGSGQQRRPSRTATRPRLPASE